MDIKMAAARIIDCLMTPITLAGGYWLMRARRFGLHNLPHTKKLLLDIGVMPIRDHYYEPLFRKSQLRRSLDTMHDLPGIEMDDAAQLSFLESLDCKKLLSGEKDVGWQKSVKNRTEIHDAGGEFCGVLQSI